MKGLLYKEWATLKSSYKQTVFFIAFLYGGISILTGQTGMAYALLVVFSILITSTISFDENSHWDIYVRTLPVTPAYPVVSHSPPEYVHVMSNHSPAPELESSISSATTTLSLDWLTSRMLVPRNS